MTKPLDTHTQPETTLDEYLTVREVADLLKFKTVRPLWQAIRAGELPAFELFAEYRIAREDLLAWLNRNRLGVDVSVEPAALSTPAKRKRGRSAASVVAEAA
jgi:excisionase family DNA binding protein